MTETPTKPMGSLSSVSTEENPEHLLSVARSLAYEAGREIMGLMRYPVVASQKSDHSLVTNADDASNTILLKGLRREFPHHGVLSEETGRAGPSDAEFVWVLDPLDGTRAYVRGIPGFSVMVGLLRRGEPYLGVVFDPVNHRLFEAVKGQGTFQLFGAKRFPLYVSDRNDFMGMHAVTSTGFSEDLAHEAERILRARFLAPIGSVGVKASYVIRRQADIYLSSAAVHLWDTCAPQVLLEEAGGVITYWDGSPLTYVLNEGPHRHPQPTIASNRHRHADLVTQLAGLLPHPEN